MNHPLGPGEVVLVSMPADSPPEGWQPQLTYDQSFTSATSFTQRDVDDGTVWYRHFGNGPYSDSFQFQVSSNASVISLHLSWREQSFQMSF